jgi:hypothetical protein
MTDPDDSPAPATPIAPPAPAVAAPAAGPAATLPPVERVRSERALRLAAALRVNLKRRKHPTSAPRDDRH